MTDCLYVCSCMANLDYYKSLGLSEQASGEEIKKAYRRLAKKYHPDAHPGDQKTETRFKEISEAYGVLSNAKKRQQYDQMRRFGFPGSRPGGGFQAQNIDFSELFQRRAGTRSPGGKANRRGTFDLDDLFDFGGFGDLFGKMFDRENGFGQNAKRPIKSADIQAKLEIPFEKAARGGKTVFSIDKETACSQCKGTGGRDGKQPEVCQNCRGSGMISKAQGLFAVNRPCPTCFGRGRVIKEPCLGCQGAGLIKAKKKYAVKISSGTEDGQKIRLSGQGNPNGDGSSGDLIITVKVLKHRFFRSKGYDVHCEIPLDKKKAESGAKVRVKTVHGSTIELNVPPKTASGKTFRLKGLGIKSEGKTGDQFVKINVL